MKNKGLFPNYNDKITEELTRPESLDAWAPLEFPASAISSTRNNGHTYITHFTWSHFTYNIHRTMNKILNTSAGTKVQGLTQTSAILITVWVFICINSILSLHFSYSLYASPIDNDMVNTYADDA